MKKSLIALAVAGAMTAPMIAQADATLYGSFRIALHDVDGSAWDIADDSSRIGIKGTVDLGLENTKGLFHWEANISTADPYPADLPDIGDQNSEIFSRRLAYIGMTGDWGTALIGKQYHPHYLWVNLPLNLANTAGGTTGEWAFLGNDWHKRTDNTLAYLSPVMNGLQFAAGAVIGANKDEATDDMDGYNVAAKWSANDLTLAASFASVDADSLGASDDNETWGVSAVYKMDGVKVAARYEDKDDGSDEADVFEIGASVAVGEGTSLKARYTDLDVEGEDSQEGWVVEAEQLMGKGRVYASYWAFDDAAEAEGKYDRLVLGYRVDF